MTYLKGWDTRKMYPKKMPVPELKGDETNLVLSVRIGMMQEKLEEQQRDIAAMRHLNDELFKERNEATYWAKHWHEKNEYHQQLMEHWMKMNELNYKSRERLEARLARSK